MENTWANLLFAVSLLHLWSSSTALDVVTTVDTFWGNGGDEELQIYANVVSDSGWDDVTVTVETSNFGNFSAMTEDTNENSTSRIYTYTIRSLYIDDAGNYTFYAESGGESKNSTVTVYIYTTDILTDESAYYIVERTEQLTISTYVRTDGDWDDVTVSVSPPNSNTTKPATIADTYGPNWRLYTASISDLMQGNYNFVVQETLGGETRTITSPVMVEISESTEVDEYLYRIAKMSDSMTDEIPNFHKYLYDAPDNTHIRDGGQDMYDQGNFLTVSTTGSEEPNIPYGKPYSDPNYEFSSISTYPFTWLMWISNGDGSEDLFSLKVAGNTGATLPGDTAQFNSTITTSSYSIHYSVTQLYNTDDAPSICEVFFHVTNEEVWSSVLPSSGGLMVGGSPPSSLENTYSVEGAPRNIMMGYMLLSRNDSEMIDEANIATVLESVTSVIEQKDGFTVTSDSESITAQPSDDSVTLTTRITTLGDWADISVEIMTPTSNSTVTDYVEDGDARLYRYIINDVSEQDNGVYTFMVTDGFGLQLRTQTELTAYSSEIIATTQEYWASGGDAELTIQTIVSAKYWNDTMVLVTRPDGSVVEAVTTSTSSSARTYTHRITNLFIEDAGEYVFSAERMGVTSSMPQSVTVNLFTITAQPGDDFTSHIIEKEKRATFIVYGICDGDWENVQAILTSPVGKQYQMTGEPGPAPHLRTFNVTIFDVVGGTYDISLVETLGTRTQTRSIKHTVEVHAMNHVDEYLYRIGLLTDDLVSYVPGWENYLYDGSDYTYIMDGGRDMYDRGNYISIAWSSGEEMNVPYGKPFQNNVTMFSSKYFYPFVSMMWIGNEDQAEETFSITVSGRSGALPSSNLETYRRVLIEGTYDVTYHVFQVYGSTDPSICEAYFLITNTHEWNSVLPDDFTLTTGGDPPLDLENTVTASGSPSNIMLGYTLLSMGDGQQVSYFEVEKILESYVAVIAQRDQFSVEPTTSDGYSAAVEGQNTTVDALVTTSGDWEGVNVEVVLPGGAKVPITEYRYTNLHTQRIYSYPITKVMYSDRGEYKFAAMDRFGEMEEAVSNLYIFNHQSFTSTTQYVGGPGDTVSLEIFVDSDSLSYTVEVDTPTLGTIPVKNWSTDSTGVRTYRHIVEDPTYEQDNGNYTFRVKEVFHDYDYNSTVTVNLAVFSVSAEVETTSYTANAGDEAIEMMVGVTTMGDWTSVLVRVYTPRGTREVTEFDQTGDPQRRNYIYVVREISIEDAGGYLFVVTETLYGEERTYEADSITVIVKETPAPEEKLSGGEIAGIVIGCVAGTALIGVLVWYCTKQKYSDPVKSSGKPSGKSVLIDDKVEISKKKTDIKMEEANSDLTAL